MLKCRHFPRFNAGHVGPSISEVDINIVQSMCVLAGMKVVVLVFPHAAIFLQCEVQA